MGNIIKANVTGIDINIQNLQTKLYNQLLNIWPISSLTYDANGRVYRNEITKKGYNPQIYSGNNEYQEIIFNDTLSAFSFFGLGETQKVNKDDPTADVFLIFMVDLSKIKPDITNDDEQARVDVEQICLSREFGFFLNSIVIGFDNVFKEYNKNQVNFRDDYPLHCFRLNFKVTYNPYDCYPAPQIII